MTFKIPYSDDFYIFRVSTQTHVMSFIMKLGYVFTLLLLCSGVDWIVIGSFNLLNLD